MSPQYDAIKLALCYVFTSINERDTGTEQTQVRSIPVFITLRATNQNARFIVQRKPQCAKPPRQLCRLQCSYTCIHVQCTCEFD